MSDLKFTMDASRACEIARTLLYTFETRYNNKFPYNCAFNGYSGNNYICGDCWNMFPKSLYWGEAIGAPVDEWYGVGHYVHPDDGCQATGLPDCTGDVIIRDYCYDTTDDFSDLMPGELLLMPGKHMGLYVGDYGEWTYGGAFYNVIEFTSDQIIGAGCRPSYVDSQGRRWSLSGKQSGSWSIAGKFKGFTYSAAYSFPMAKDLIRAILNYQIIPVIKKDNEYYWINCWIQEALRAAGFYKGTVDGFYGSYTEQGVKDFQKVFGLAETGELDNNDLAVMVNNYYKEEK